MTISPPANVKTPKVEPPSVLASGIDSLVLAMDLTWPNDETFALLTELKAKSKADGQEATGLIRSQGGEWVFTVKPHGRDGYEWLLDSAELAISLNASRKPGTRPGAMVSLRAETLWHLGPVGSMRRVVELLDAMQAVIEKTKVSRVDLCADVLLNESDWHIGLMDCLVTRAASRVPHYQFRNLTGISIGKGSVHARFYDKPLEIAQKSKKEWMYDIWGLEIVPAGCRIIRVEFQLRREAIKELGVDTFDDLMKLSGNVWSYCSRSWLKVQDDASLHHTQQQTLPWWVVVQEGFMGAQGVCSAVRAKAVRIDEKQILQQLAGYAVADVALLLGDTVLQPGETLDMQSYAAAVQAGLDRLGMTDQELTKKVKHKQAKLLRSKIKYAKALEERRRLGLSSGGSSTKDTGPES